MFSVLITAFSFALSCTNLTRFALVSALRSLNCDVAIFESVIYCKCRWLSSISLVQELKFLTGIRKMLVSKTVLSIGHRYWRFSWLFSVIPGIVETHQVRQWMFHIISYSYYLSFQHSTLGPGVAQWLRQCANSRAVPGSNRRSPGFFSWIPTEPCALGLTQPLKNEYQGFPWK